MIVDAFLYAGELRMAELRMRTLADVVGVFVAVQCSHTHQGERLDDALRHSQEEDFRRLGDDLRVKWFGYTVNPSMLLKRGQGVTIERPPGHRGEARTPFFQHIEKQHRDGVKEAVLAITDDPDTMVMVSDVDEIPDPEWVRRLSTWAAFDPELAIANMYRWFVFPMRFHSTALDLLHPQQPWWGTCVAKLRDLEPQAMRDARTTIGSPDQSVGLVAGVGNDPDRRPELLDPSGWHFSWFGTDEERQRKLDTFSHAELRGWDHARGRAMHRHSNGERLTLIDRDRWHELEWPLPIANGQFSVPQEWRL